MKFTLIYPRWPKLKRQNEFHLPPHGPIVFAASVPRDVEIEFIDENLETIDFDKPTDFVGISAMLTCQIKRGWEIAAVYRRKGVRVIFGGIGTMLHGEETMAYADSVFLGEAEGRMERVFSDFKRNRLRPVYDYLDDHPPVEIVGNARREILKRNLYNYRGIQMVDPVHASRGCRFHCYPCAVAFLGGRKFRPRPVEKAVAEMASIDNNRLFLVDNSLAQDTTWEMELFREMIPIKKKWCSHPIEDKLKVLDLAAQAGAWYVYQAIFDSSDYIRERIKRYHDHGIAVQGTVLLGLDNHTEDFIKDLVDFLLEIELDLAEFTVLAPFPHTKAFDDLNRQNRIFSLEWNDYTADKVVYYPRHMTPDRLEAMLDYAWDTFYADESQNMKMSRLFQKVIQKEQEDKTYQPRKRELATVAFGKQVDLTKN
jgi:radical SAM superfamily enzyme YgiQ (UPF0313 family)